MNYQRNEKYFGQSIPAWPTVVSFILIAAGLFVFIFLGFSRFGGYLFIPIGLCMAVAGLVGMVLISNIKIKDSEIDELIPPFEEEFRTEFTSRFVGKPNGRGGKFVCYGLNSRGFIRGGKMTGATPDGRHKGDHFSKNMAPSVGAETEGITGSIRSYGAIAPENFPCGAVLPLHGTFRGRISEIPGGTEPGIPAGGIQCFPGKPGGGSAYSGTVRGLERYLQGD